MTPIRNLIVVLCHGLRSDAVSDERRWPLDTPNIRRWAERGLRVVAGSSCPNNPGGWTTLLTGLHGRQHGLLDHGVSLPMLHDTFALWLREAGYHVAGVGQVAEIEQVLDQAVVTHDVAEIEPVGCRYLSEINAQGLAQAIKQQRKQRLRHGPLRADRLLLEPDHDIDGYIGSTATQMIEEMPTDKPWALIVAFSGPGNDLPPPPLYSDLVTTHRLSDDFIPADIASIDELASPSIPRARLQNLTPQTIARLRADYLGRVALIDHGIGCIEKAVQQRQDAGSTWSVLGSDHGVLLGEHGLLGDRSFLAEAIETPLIVAPPVKGPRPRVRYLDMLASTTDLAPTIAALGQAHAPSALPGRSLLSAFAKAETPKRRGGNISELPDRIMLETERHKVVFSLPSGRPMALYDLLNDGRENRNLVASPVGRNILDSLRARLSDALLPLRAQAY